MVSEKNEEFNCNIRQGTRSLRLIFLAFPRQKNKLEPYNKR